MKNLEEMKMLKITGEKLGYPVYENKNYSVCAHMQNDDRLGIEIEYNGRWNSQRAIIYPHSGKIAFDYPEALPKYVIDKVYILAEKIKKDGGHLEGLKNKQVVIPSPTEKKCKNCIHWRTSFMDNYELSPQGWCTLTRDLRKYFEGTECEKFIAH